MCQKTGTSSFLYLHPSSILPHPSPIIPHPSSIFHPPSPILHHPSSIISHPSSLLPPPSSILHPPSSITHPPSSLTHPPSYTSPILSASRTSPCRRFRIPVSPSPRPPSSIVRASRRVCRWARQGRCPSVGSRSRCTHGCRSLKPVPISTRCLGWCRGGTCGRREERKVRSE